jgi:cation diffusion facilitator CzcD-associated flavoprotein CzcO
MEEALARYAQERDKRVRPDGQAQYRELKGEYAEFDQDPYVEPGFTREPIVEQTQAVVVGGGFAGMLTAINLKARGIQDLRIVEKGGDFGGTWYWNRYPGCMCDVESYTYLPLLEETGFMPSMKYASAPEIFGYCQLIGRHYDLYPHALFQTEIEGAAWNEDEQRWLVTTTRGDQLSTRFLITAGGVLSKAKLPGIPGIEDFEGRTFHTSRWDYGYTGGGPGEPMTDLADKRVGIIGTGATGVQVVPQLGRDAKEVYVFQRTPSAVGVRDNGPTDEAWYRSLEPGWHEARVVNFTQAVTGAQPDHNLVDDGWTHVMWEDTRSKAETPEQAEANARSDFATMEAIRRRVDELVEDPETAEKLKPWYGKHCKRVCFHDEYLPAFNRPNVHLVDTEGRGVEKITPTGVVVDGHEYPIDLLVFASGFEVATDLDRRLGFDPVGRNGMTLSQRWHDGAHSLHGILTAELPNLLAIGVVQAGFGTNFLHFLSESAKHVAWLVATCEEQGIGTIEAVPEAEEEWLGVLYGVAQLISGYAANCTPGLYNGELGRDKNAMRNLVYTGSLLDYAGYLERWREAGDLAGTKTVTRTTDA